MPPTLSAAAKARRAPLIRIIACVILSLIVIVGVIVLITWLVVQPRKLGYTIEQGSISVYNTSRSDRLNADYQFVLRANNPNRRISLYYDRIVATVSFEDRVVSSKVVHPFYQPRRNVTHLDLYLTSNDTAVDGAVAGDLAMERAMGEIDVDVRIRAKIRLKIGAFKIHRKLEVLCGPVTVAFNSSKGFERVYCEADIDD